MSDQPTFNRRRVLELSGVGTTLAVAGCTSQLDDNGLEGDRGELEDDERRVTMGLEIDQEQLQQQQMEIQQQVEGGEMDEEEAQAEIEALQEELVGDAFETVQSEFEQFDITIEDTLDDGIMLVAGPATDLIDALELDIIQVMAAEALFEEAQQAQEQPAPEEGEPTPEEGEPEPEEDEEGDEPTEEELEEEIEEELEDAEAEDD